jgi:hypothetical protein
VVLGSAIVAAAVVVGILASVGIAITIAIGMLTALGFGGWSLWRAAPDRAQAKSSLGTGILVSVVVAAAVGGAQFAIEERRDELAQHRQQAADRAAERQGLLLTLGLQRNLVGIDLSGRDLARAVLTSKDLSRSVLVNVNLRRADLSGTTLREANLTGADLQRANLTAADLRSAALPRATLRDAELRGAQFGDADLPGADLRGANLTEADLRGANLVNANLVEANLFRADLRHANLAEADLRGAVTLGARFDDPGIAHPGRAGGTGPSCARRGAVLKLRFSASDYPHVKTHTEAAIRSGWPAIMVLNRAGAYERRERALQGIGAAQRQDRDQYPPAIGRGRPNGNLLGLVQGVNPLGWMAHFAVVPSKENRSHGAALGALLSRYCDGTRFRFVFS